MKKKGKYLRNYFVDKYMDFYYDTINVPQEKKYSKLVFFKQKKEKTEIKAELENEQSKVYPELHICLN